MSFSWPMRFWAISPIVLALMLAGSPALAAGDTTAPTLISVTGLTPASVDVTSASATVTMTFHATDDLSGLSYAYCDFHPASGGQIVRIDAAFNGALDETVSGTGTVPQFAAGGTWTLSVCTTADQVGNRRDYSLSDAQTAGWPTSFDAFSNTAVLPVGRLVNATFAPHVRSAIKAKLVGGTLQKGLSFRALLGGGFKIAGKARTTSQSVITVSLAVNGTVVEVPFTIVSVMAPHLVFDSRPIPKQALSTRSATTSFTAETLVTASGMPSWCAPHHNHTGTLLLACKPPGNSSSAYRVRLRDAAIAGGTAERVVWLRVA